MNKANVDTSVELFKSGKIGIFPTDTAFGIGCVIDNEEAIKKLFEIRKRPLNKPTPVLVNSTRMVEEITKSKIPDDIVMLINTYWPGGLTLVLPNMNEKIPQLVTGGTRTLGVRMPNHEVMLSIIERVAKPILAPSANFAGEPTPFSLQEVDRSLIELADFIIDGECYGNDSSTVLDCVQKPYKILRQGIITIDPKLL